MSSGERVRALLIGPLACMRRRRSIEDLDETLVAALAGLCVEAVRAGEDPSTYAKRRAPTAAFERLRELVRQHNRYYPIEANLALCPRTGELLERNGERWRPFEEPRMDDLIARAAARL